MYIDRNGLIIQRSGDSGDTAQREGMYFFATGTLALNQVTYLTALTHLQKDGIWIRNPIQYNDPKDFSRDQMDPNIICLGSYKMSYYAKLVLKDTFWEHIKRGFKYQNDDLPMLTTFSLYIRAFRAWYLYPLLLLFDLAFLACPIEAALDKNPNSVDDNNMIMRFLQALYLPTPWSFIARRLYAKYRPINFGCHPEKNTVMAALLWYHRSEAGGNIEIAEAYRPLIYKYFAQE